MLGRGACLKARYEEGRGNVEGVLHFSVVHATIMVLNYFCGLPELDKS